MAGELAVVTPYQLPAGYVRVSADSTCFSLAEMSSEFDLPLRTAHVAPTELGVESHAY